MMRSSTRLASLTLVALFALTACGGSQTITSNSETGASASADAATPNPSNSQDGAQTADAASSEEAEEEPKTLHDGSREIFDNKRYVALYGAPSGPSLGVLGEQGPAASVERVKKLAAEFQPHSKETVTPAFEIITTVASSAPGIDGDYSDESTIDQVLPLIEEAEKNGVYVILDFQPGRSDFLSQIKQYEDLLKRPNVGVGLDPEWRLAPHQVHLEQIGSVDAAEVNQVLDYLAELTQKNELPQKMVVLHQFTLSMITNRDALDTSHPELALTLHADGHGTPELKMSSYETLLQGLSKEIKPSWKNFYDEDTPMLTPAQTYEIEPKPWVVTYQ